MMEKITDEIWEQIHETTRSSECERSENMIDGIGDDEDPLESRTAAPKECVSRGCTALRPSIDLLKQSDVVSLQHDAPNGFASSFLHVNLLCSVHDEIHVLIEADDVAFDARVDVFIQPNRDSRSILKVPEDQIDRLNHDLLDLSAFVRHDNALD